MLLKKTKLAGIISLVFCSNAMAVSITDLTSSITIPTDGQFGPFVSAMDTSSAATSTAIYTNTYAQSFTYDIGAPWTYGASQYDEYCVYNSDVCEMLWDGARSDGSDGLHSWRINILNTYAGGYKSESTAQNKDGVSVKVTALDGSTPVGYNTSDTQGEFVRRAFYGEKQLLSAGDSDQNGGFSSAHDVAQVDVKSKDNSAIEFSSKLIVGQSNIRTSGSSQFDYCFNYGSSDDRYDYGDLYNCPGYDLQASYWNAEQLAVNALYFASDWINGGTDAVLIANAYAINTSGFAVGFSTKQVYSSTSGGRARATVFKPNVQADSTLKYARSEIVKPDDDDVIRDTVAIDITDQVYVEPVTVGGDGTFSPANGTDASQPFIIVGNRTYSVAQNRSYATEFYTYDLASGETHYPFQANPIKGANSQVSKINNDGLVVGWRDARGETSPTADGSARFQSAFVYDYKNKKSAYLDDLYCKEINDGNISGDVRYRFSNAISITDNNSNSYTIVANGFDYKNAENYKNRTGSSPVVLSMTVTKDELNDFDNSSQCPVKAEEDYERSGAGMGWFVLLPTMMLLFRRFKRD
ncbi:DUF3466 family protein [Moritella sp. F3]|uniref:DUF3466 family protein n=1 Tax=Moritella sp. F3 TaxID=2718882 RepID=UPI0018E1D491|nr:DUF3466 family protein [Moritella sp. F3]GIC79669.1 GlyGly-CTERM sorting domain-containing protein [Moritella sp. F1]GIC79744.1 GlyGly-CTERM sorting domain-containing protein [Moritella sp. F3]